MAFMFALPMTSFSWSTLSSTVTCEQVPYWGLVPFALRPLFFLYILTENRFTGFAELRTRAS